MHLRLIGRKSSPLQAEWALSFPQASMHCLEGAHSKKETDRQTVDTKREKLTFSRVYRGLVSKL